MDSSVLPLCVGIGSLLIFARESPTPTEVTLPLMGLSPWKNQQHKRLANVGFAKIIIFAIEMEKTQHYALKQERRH